MTDLFFYKITSVMQVMHNKQTTHWL